MDQFVWVNPLDAAIALVDPVRERRQFWQHGMNLNKYKYANGPAWFLDLLHIVSEIDWKIYTFYGAESVNML
jgi:hypothetical protein